MKAKGKQKKDHQYKAARRKIHINTEGGLAKSEVRQTICLGVKIT